MRLTSPALARERSLLGQRAGADQTTVAATTVPRCRTIIARHGRLGRHIDFGAVAQCPRSARRRSKALMVRSARVSVVKPIAALRRDDRHDCARLKHGSGRERNNRDAGQKRNGQALKLAEKNAQVRALVRRWDRVCPDARQFLLRAGGRQSVGAGDAELARDGLRLARMPLALGGIINDGRNLAAQQSADPFDQPGEGGRGLVPQRDVASERAGRDLMHPPKPVSPRSSRAASSGAPRNPPIRSRAPGTTVCSGTIEIGIRMRSPLLPARRRGCRVDGALGSMSACRFRRRSEQDRSCVHRARSRPPHHALPSEREASRRGATLRREISAARVACAFADLRKLGAGFGHDVARVLVELG